MVELTKTSPAPASAMIRAPACTAIPRGFPPATRSTSPVCTPHRTSSPSDAERLTNRHRAPDRASGAVEEREEAIPGGVDLLAAETGELRTDRAVVPAEK